jgi:hypothetical protein
LGSITFAYNAYVIAFAKSLTLIQTITWFPLIMLFFFKGIFDPDKKYFSFCLSGIFLALSFLCGAINVTFYMFAVLLFCAIWFWVRGHGHIVPLKGLLIIFIITTGLSAVQVIPTFEYFDLSVRKHISYDLITLWGSVPPFHFINFFAPHFFGGAGVTDWGSSSGILSSGFHMLLYNSSVIALLLVATGVFLRPKTRISEIYLFLFFLMLLSLFLMMGKHNAVFGWLYSLPMLPVTRVPSRWAYFMAFSLSSFAGISFSVLSTPLAGSNKKPLKQIFNKFIRPIVLWLPLSVLPLIFVLLIKSNIASAKSIIHFLVFFYLFAIFIFIRLFKRYRVKYGYLLIIVVTIELFMANQRVLSWLPDSQIPEIPSKSFEDSQLIKFLKNDKDIFRVSGLEWPLNYGHITKIFTLGYMGGFHYSRLADFRGQTDPMGSSGLSWFNNIRNNPLSQLIDFYNIKYFIISTDLEKELPQKYEKIEGLENLYRNKNVFKRAFFVSDYEVVPDNKSVLERMEQVDLSKKVILEEDPGFKPFIENTHSEVKITDYKTQAIELKAKIKQNGLLVTSEVYYPGWLAYVDGKRTKIFRANYVFRAIKLSPGEHKIKFIYSPFSVKIGLFITLLTGGVLLVIFSVKRHFR